MERKEDLSRPTRLCSAVIEDGDNMIMPMEWNYAGISLELIFNFFQFSIESKPKCIKIKTQLDFLFFDSLFFLFWNKN